MAFIFSRNERVYVVGDVDGSSNPIFNTVAQLTPGNTNYICVVRGNLAPGANELLRNPCKTGTLSNLAGIRGRGSAGWALEIPVQGNGAAGTAPDASPLLVALFGAKPTIVGATSVSYALADVIGSMTIYDYWSPATASHICAFGCIVGDFRIAATAQLATMSFSGPAVWAIDSNDFSGLSADEKGGITTFATEPASPSSNGTPVAGFLGSITIDGTSTFSLISWSLGISTGASIDHVYGKYIPTLSSRDRRTVSLDFTIRDEDSAVAALQTLKTKLRVKTAFDVTLVMGATAGNIWTWTIKGLQYGGYAYDDSGNRRNFSAGGGIATASSATAKNEIALAIT